MTAKTFVCPTCGHRHREDRKNINRWMALAIEAFAASPHPIIHAATYLKAVCPDGARGHDYALLRHWELITPVPRPAWATDEQKGSRGMSGFYTVTALGYAFAGGKALVYASIIRPIGQSAYVFDTASDLISIHDAKASTMVTTPEHVVVNGETR